MEELHDIRCADIVVGDRFRKDLGDLAGLARSIESIGLLQPIGIAPDNRLIFGERRLRAVRDLLNRETIPARVVNVASILDGEYAENEVRKDFTPSERHAIAEAVAEAIGNRQGERTDLRPDGEPRRHGGKVPRGERTDDVAAKVAGFGSADNRERVRRVVQTGVPELVEAMDSGAASIRAAADVATLPADVQHKVVAGGPEEMKRVATEIRERRPKRRALADELAVREARKVAEPEPAPVTPPEPEPLAPEAALAAPPLLDERTAGLLARARALTPPARPARDDGWFTVRISVVDKARDRYNVRAYYAGTGATAENTWTGRDNAEAVADALWRSYLSRDGWPEPATDAPAAHPVRGAGAGKRGR